MNRIQRPLCAALAIVCLFVFSCAAMPAADAQIRTYTAYLGTYSSGTTYNAGDIVTVGSVSYVSILPSNTGNAPASSTTYWTPIGSAGAAAAGVAGTEQITDGNGALKASDNTTIINSLPIQSFLTSAQPLLGNWNTAFANCSNQIVRVHITADSRSIEDTSINPAVLGSNIAVSFPFRYAELLRADGLKSCPSHGTGRIPLRWRTGSLATQGLNQNFYAFTGSIAATDLTVGPYQPYTNDPMVVTTTADNTVITFTSITPYDHFLCYGVQGPGLNAWTMATDSNPVGSCGGTAGSESAVLATSSAFALGTHVSSITCVTHPCSVYATEGAAGNVGLSFDNDAVASSPLEMFAYASSQYAFRRLTPGGESLDIIYHVANEPSNATTTQFQTSLNTEVAFVRGQTSPGSALIFLPILDSNTGQAPYYTVLHSTVLALNTASANMQDTYGTAQCPSNLCGPDSIHESLAGNAAEYSILKRTMYSAANPYTNGIPSSPNGPYLAISPAVLSFGSSPTGTATSSQAVNLTISGSTPITFSGTTTITGPGAASFTRTNVGCATTMNPGTSCTNTVVCNPTATGIQNAVMTFLDNSYNAPQTVSLVCTGTAGSNFLSVTPSSLTFGSNAVGTPTASQAVTITNSGTTAVTFSGTATITGSGASSYARTNVGCNTTMNPGDTCTNTFVFTASTAGDLPATVTYTDSASNSPQTVAMDGQGVSAGTPTASFSPTSISFPTTTTGSTSAVVTTTLTNSGSASMTISGITLTGTNPSNFAQTNTCGSTLAAGANCVISATFTPSSAASFTANISVADNATGSPQTVALSGTGSSTPAPIAGFSPASLTFPNTVAGSTATAISTTLQNTGTAVLNISSITITGVNTADFALTTSSSPCGSTLAVGSSCVIAVSFTPAGAASYSAYISVADNASGSPQTAALNGTGTANPMTVTSSLAFGTQSTGTTSSPQAITLTNPGSTPMTLTSAVLGGTSPSAYTLANNTCTSSLAAGASCAYSVTFNPATGSASFPATVTFTNSATNSPQTTTLSGAGSVSVISLSPQVINFPTTTHGSSSAAITLTITNTGSSGLTTTSATTITGSGASAFTRVNVNCTNPLAAGASCTNTYTFTPPSTGSYTATVTLFYPTGTNQQTLVLNGTGN